MVRRVVWGMLYADDAGVVLTSPRGLMVVACQEVGLTVSQKKTEFVYLGGAISEIANLDTKSKRRIGAAWASVRKYSSQLYDRRNARLLSLKTRLFKAEVMEAMLYGCATWTPCALRTLAPCVLPTTSYFCASSAFGPRTAPGINLCRIGRFSRGPVPNASK